MRRRMGGVRGMSMGSGHDQTLHRYSTAILALARLNGEAVAAPAYLRLDTVGEYSGEPTNPGPRDTRTRVPGSPVRRDERGGPGLVHTHPVR